MSFNEDSRVKIPALVHLTRLGYNYISRYQKKHEYSFDSETNIITNVFVEKLKQLNPKLSPEQIDAELKNIKEELDFDDLGRSFYKRLIGVGDSDTKLIDWQNFNNNSFHITTELTCRNGEDEFRPDITVFINGLPLSFIEVKKPNNEDGIKAERNRINTRFKNDKFRRFINITQLIMFSNNMEYDDTDKHQLRGDFCLDLLGISGCFARSRFGGCFCWHRCRCQSHRS